MRQVGETILSSIINAIIQMGLRWVEMEIMKLAVGKTVAATTLAVNTATAAAEAAIWLEPAILATIASFGEAALAAPGEVGSAMLLGFAEGGYTGNGSPSGVAGVVHNREFVFSAPAVDRIGLPTLQAMHQGEAPASAAGGGSQPHIHVNFFPDGEAMNRHARTNPEFKHIQVDTIGQNAHVIPARR